MVLYCLSISNKWTNQDQFLWGLDPSKDGAAMVEVVNFLLLTDRSIEELLPQKTICGKLFWNLTKDISINPPAAAVTYTSPINYFT